MKKRMLFAALIPSFVFSNPLQPGVQTLTIAPDQMPKVLAFMQKQGRLPTPDELNNEQATFCNVVGACTTGFVTTIVTGNPGHVLSAIASTILPLISRGNSKNIAVSVTVHGFDTIFTT